MDDGDLLDGPPGGPDELRAIVARAGRHRRRAVLGAAGVAGGVALVAGGLIGYAASSRPSNGHTLVAGATATTAPAVGGRGATPESPAAGANVSSPAQGGYPTTVYPIGGALRHLFTRSVGNIEIRGLLPATTSAYPVCSSGPGLLAEVSTPAMVGTATLLTPSTTSGAGLLGAQLEILGQREDAPAAVVVVHTGTSVADVTVTFLGSDRDRMAPVSGWSALAADVPVGAEASGVTAEVQALDGAGRVLQDARLTTSSPYWGAPAAMPMCETPCGSSGVPKTPSGSVTTVPAARRPKPAGSASGSGGGTASAGTGTVYPVAGSTVVCPVALPTAPAGSGSGTVSGGGMP